MFVSEPAAARTVPHGRHAAACLERAGMISDMLTATVHIIEEIVYVLHGDLEIGNAQLIGQRRRLIEVRGNDNFPLEHLDGAAPNKRPKVESLPHINSSFQDPHGFAHGLSPKDR